MLPYQNPVMSFPQPCGTAHTDAFGELGHAKVSSKRISPSTQIGSTILVYHGKDVLPHKGRIRDPTARLYSPHSLAQCGVFEQFESLYRGQFVCKLEISDMKSFITRALLRSFCGWLGIAPRVWTVHADLEESLAKQWFITVIFRTSCHGACSVSYYKGTAPSTAAVSL